jgi:hypothetical protein
MCVLEARHWMSFLRFAKSKLADFRYNIEDKYKVGTVKTRELRVKMCFWGGGGVFEN